MSASCITTTAGWKEWVELPDIGVPKIEAKVDTGTAVSILYASFIDHFRRENDLWVRFCVNFVANGEPSRVVCQAPVKRTEILQSSGNHNESFFVIEAKINIGNLQTQHDIVIKNQIDEQHDMCLGRNALQALNIQVDPNCSFVVSNKGNQPFRQVPMCA